MADNSLGAKVGVPVVLPVITEWESWTPTGSWSTNTTYTGRKRRIGSQGYYEVKIVTAGAPTSASLTINMPSGEVINTTDELIQYASGVLGWGVARDTGVLPYLMTVGYTSTTVVSAYAVSRPTTYATNSDAATQAVPFTFGASDEIYLRWDVPIVAFAGSANIAYGAGLATSVKSGLVSYEDSGSFTVYLKSGTTIGGAATTGQNGTAYYSRVGKTVTVHIPGLAQTTTNTIFLLSTSDSAGTNTWPAGLTPVTASRFFTSIIQVGGTGVVAFTSLSTAGALQIFADASGNAFGAGSSAKGTLGCSLSYVIN